MLAGFDPLVAEWFATRFGAPTEPQVRGWPEIRAGHDVLISAPTGSGKTLAAFLTAIEGLVRRARLGPLPDATEIVYVSPLKALSNDVHKNLELPLAEIGALAALRGVALAPIRTALRTGDTPQAERQKMTRQRPHILVTTPESLYILLTAAKPREMLGRVRTVIVDEIHAVADDKRGSHLALTLARLDRLVQQNGGAAPQRIGLSATVKPIEDVAQFLGGHASVIQVGHRREMDLAIEVPRDELGPVATNEMWDEIYDRVAELIRAHRTTLVFVNTRRLAERVAHHLGERLGIDAVLPHHGSLSRALRLDAEQKLKNGELRAVVATASLELGIDIGAIDLVCQIGSPRSIAVALQRIGRAGHWVGALPKGRLFATTRDELIECAALVRAIHHGELDRLEIPRNALDILAQQMVAACACEDFAEDDLFALMRAAAPYATLPRADFDAVLEMLSEGIATARGHSRAYLHRDAVNRRVHARRGARMTAITSGGAIPETAQYLVVAEPEGVTVGTVDEDFAVESMAGDIFLLGTTSWRIRRVEAGRLRVEDSHGAVPTIPFWRGEAPGRTLELSREVASLREEISRSGACPAECGLDHAGADQAIAYVQAGRAALGAIPTDTCVIAERFFDEGGGMQLVIHAPLGARINRAWGLALRKRFCRSFNFELQAAATDNGILISLGEQHSFPLDIVFEFLRPATVEEVLTQAVLPAPMFTARWRWNASRALTIPRFEGGRKVPPPIQRMRSDDLMAAVFPDQAACPENLTGDVRIPDHPLVKETVSNCLYEAMDLDGLRSVLAAIHDGAIRTMAIDTPEPSPFSHEILNSNPFAFLDDAPLEERRARMVQMRRTLPDDSQGAGALDASAIAQVAAEAWPPTRDAEELHEALCGWSLIPVGEVATLAEFETLAAARRATVLTTGGREFWVPAERLALVLRVYPNATFRPPIAPPQAGRAIPESPEACAAEILRGWFECSGPLRASHLAQTLAMPRELVDHALAQLEVEGQILRGRFTPNAAEPEIEWCHRNLLARIHRLTIGRLRREIEPVTTAAFFAFLNRWQHRAPGTQLHGVDGTLQIIRQWQGAEFPAAAWESEVLPRYVASYRSEYLDDLCLAGEVTWGRLSPHPAFEREPEESKGRRVRPTRVAPLAIFLREDSSWLLAAPQASPQTSLSHPAREVLAALESHGASFFADLTRVTGRLASEVEDALWELVAAGLVTADGFENLRALLDPKRRAGQGRERSRRPRHAPGRWALLR
ncbi:MAG: DEAD/DEAH box helicase, partial [Bryobacteraceae bacterium]